MGGCTTKARTHLRFNPVLLSGDIEENPGPEDYQVDPRLVPLILEALGSPPPVGDAFARPHNALFRQRWGVEADAFVHSWRPSLLGPLWLNPPFSQLSAVEQKIRREGAYVVLICPGWRRVLPSLMELSTCHYRLPDGPTFRRAGRELLPQRDWPTYALLINHTPNPRVHTPLLSCGDVESNPGPEAGPCAFASLEVYLIAERMTDLFTIQTIVDFENGPASSTTPGAIQLSTVQCGL